MDIAGLSTILKTNELQAQIGTAVLSKALDMGEELSTGLVVMIDASAMELSVNPNVGGNIDIRI